MCATNTHCPAPGFVTLDTSPTWHIIYVTYTTSVFTWTWTSPNPRLLRYVHVYNINDEQSMQCCCLMMMMMTMMMMSPVYVHQGCMCSVNIPCSLMLALLWKDLFCDTAEVLPKPTHTFTFRRHILIANTNTDAYNTPGQQGNNKQCRHLHWIICTCMSFRHDLHRNYTLRKQIISISWAPMLFSATKTWTPKLSRFPHRCN